MRICRTIGKQVEQMDVNPSHIKTYLKAGWIEVKEPQIESGEKDLDIESSETPESPKKMGRPKKQA